MKGNNFLKIFDLVDFIILVGIIVLLFNIEFKGDCPTDTASMSALLITAMCRFGWLGVSLIIAALVSFVALIIGLTKLKNKKTKAQ